MKKIGVFYGSSTGNTEAIAKTIAKRLDADCYNVANKPANEIQQYSSLILGTSTWGVGDLQDDWERFIGELTKADLTGKKVALFGLGDSDTYPDNFVDGLGLIYEAIKSKGCTFIGAVETDGYNFSESRAVVEDHFVGLPLDEDNESKLTRARLDKWLEEITKAL